GANPAGAANADPVARALDLLEPHAGPDEREQVAVGGGAQVLRGPCRNDEVVRPVALGANRLVPDPALEGDLLPAALAPAERERGALLDRREDGTVGRRMPIFTRHGEPACLRERGGGRKQDESERERAKHPGNRVEAVRLSVERQARTAERECQFARGRPLACPRGRV